MWIYETCYISIRNAQTKTHHKRVFKTIAAITLGKDKNKHQKRFFDGKANRADTFVEKQV